MTAPLGQPQWHVVAPYWQPPPPPEPLLRRADLATLIGTTVFVAVTAPVVGLLWSHFAPTLSIAQAAQGAEAPYRAQIGADWWFLLLSALAGVTTAAIALALRGRGPGVLTGLVLGGVLGAVIADRVGYLARYAATVSTLHNLGLPVRPDVLSQVDFRVRALAVLLAWPLAAIAVHAATLALRTKDPA